MNKKPILGGIIALVVLVSVGAVVIAGGGGKKNASSNSMSGMNMSASSTSTSSDSKAVATDSVTIMNFAFSPTHITVKTGTTVSWTNMDVVGHTVSSDSGTTLNSPLLKNNDTYKHTFSTAGTYSYHCNPHPYMKAIVTVTN